MRAALAILVLVAGIAPAMAQPCNVDCQIARMSEANRLYDARLAFQAHRQNMAAWYSWRAAAQVQRRPLRWHACRSTPWERSCSYRIRY